MLKNKLTDHLKRSEPKTSTARSVFLIGLVIISSSIGFGKTTKFVASNSKEATGVNYSQTQWLNLPPKESPFKFPMSLSYSSNTYREDQPDFNRVLELELSPRLKLDNVWSVSGNLTIEKEDSGQQETHLSNTELRMTAKVWKPSHTSSVNLSFGGYLPTNRVVVDSDSYQGAFRLGAAIDNQSRYVTLGYGLSLVRNVHEFTVKRDGAENLMYALNHSANVNIQFTKALNLALSGIYRQALTYDESQRYLFLTAAELSYAWSNSFTTMMGINTSGNAVKADGRESNVSLYDDKFTNLRIGVQYEI